MNKTWLLGGALLLSLAGNAFLGGWLLGRPATMLGYAHEQAGPTERHMKQLMARIHQLPEQQRQQVHETMHRYAPQLRELSRAERKERQLIEQLMLTPDLPRSELDAAFARQRERLSRMLLVKQQMLLDIASQLPAEQRAELLKPARH